MAGPTFQISRCGHGFVEVVFNLFEDVDERRRKGDSVVDGETETMCLTRTMIRVLADNHHLRLVEWTEVESIENQFGRWVNGRCLVLFSDETGENFEIGLVKFLLQRIFPSLFYFYIHNSFVVFDIVWSTFERGPSTKVVIFVALP